MTTRCRHRAKNSLSLKKFMDRLDRGLPIFMAYGEEPSITHHKNCRNLHWVKWRSGPGGAEFVDVTTIHSSYVHEGHVSLKDMNVYRNKYNKNFAFRTRWAAEQYLQDIA